MEVADGDSGHNLPSQSRANTNSTAARPQPIAPTTLPLRLHEAIGHGLFFARLQPPIAVPAVEGG